MSKCIIKWTFLFTRKAILSRRIHQCYMLHNFTFCKIPIRKDLNNEIVAESVCLLVPSFLLLFSFFSPSTVAIFLSSLTSFVPSASSAVSESSAAYLLAFSSSAYFCSPPWFLYISCAILSICFLRILLITYILLVDLHFSYIHIRNLSEGIGSRMDLKFVQ